MPYCLNDFDYDLPDGFIAQKPMKPRHKARMLYRDISGHLSDYTVKDIINIIPRHSVLVVNNTKTLPALLHGHKYHANGEHGAKIQCNLHHALTPNFDAWHVFVKGTKKLRQNDVVIFAKGFHAVVTTKHGDGSCIFTFNKTAHNFFDAIHQAGSMPLPPYIKRHAKDSDDVSDYQTIFAKQQGAVATPTASLHFDDIMLECLRNHDVIIEEITLHVGAGTFLPVKTQQLNDHIMHKEYMAISDDNADRLNQYKHEGRPIITVGTTCLRALESAAHDDGLMHSFYGDTDIFITPGYRFKYCDMLLTNFHLPKSTLLMLVAAFIGFDAMHALYKHAIMQEYRFFSYGDCCLLARST